MIYNKSMKYFLLIFLNLIFVSAFSQSTHTVFHVVKYGNPQVSIRYAQLNGKQWEITKYNFGSAKPVISNEYCNWYELISYDVSAKINGKLKTVNSKSSEFSSVAREIDQKLQVGGFVVFDKIKFKDPKGKIKEYKGIKLKVVS